GLNTVSSFPAATGGSVVLSLSCLGRGSKLAVSRFDVAGTLVCSTKLSDGNGCVESMSAVTDELDHTLVVVAEGFGAGTGHVAARWFDRTCDAITGWFDGGTSMVRLRPLIGGGAVGLHADHWTGSF